MMIQQSNCFVVVGGGVGMQNAMRKKGELAASGERSSNTGKARWSRQTSSPRPRCGCCQNNAGGVGGDHNFASPANPVLGAAGGLKFKEAQTSMLLSDAHFGAGLAAASEGSTKKADRASARALFGGGGAFGAVGGYSSNT